MLARTRDIVPSRWAAVWSRVHLPPWVWYPVGVYAFARIALTAWALLVILILPMASRPSSTSSLYYGPTESGIGYYLLEPWHRWDTNWYLRIAATGYAPGDGSLAFFPLYPVLIRAAGMVFGEAWLLSALLISNIAALLFLVLLFRIVSGRFGEQVARNALLYLVAFPTGFFLFCGYNESLFLLLAIAALHCASRGQWARAGLLNGLAALTRLQGVVLLVPLLVEFLMQPQARRHVASGLGRLLGASLVGAAYWVYVPLVFGNPAVWAASAAVWRRTTWPGESIWATIRYLASGGDFGLANNWFDLASAVFVVTLVIWGLRRLPAALAVYSVAMILPPLITVQTAVPMLPLASLPRYGIILFPVFIVLGQARIRAGWKMALVSVSLAIQALFVALFVEGIWIA